MEILYWTKDRCVGTNPGSLDEAVNRLRDQPLVNSSTIGTEREGFEPSMRFKPHTAFPVLLLRPLGHLSGDAVHDRAAEPADKWSSGLFGAHETRWTSESDASAVRLNYANPHLRQECNRASVIHLTPARISCCKRSFRLRPRPLESYNQTGAEEEWAAALLK